MALSMRSMMAVAALAAVAACSSNDTNGPGTQEPGFDPRRVKDGLAAVEEVSRNEVLASFQALGVQIGGAQTAAAGGADRFVAAVREVAGIVRPEMGAQLIPIIRSPMLGRTFVWDAAGKRYVVDPARTGAPANGVRFILYRLDPATDKPTSAEIGSADLIDDKAGSSSSAGLRLKVVSGGTTYLDYGFELSGSIATAVVRVQGYLSDGTERVDFDLKTTGQLFGRGGRVTLEAKLEVASKQFAVETTVSGVAGSESGDGDVTLTVTAGADVVEIAATTAAGIVDATVEVNGDVFATIKGPVASPTIRGEGGRGLTTEELTALGEAFAFADGVFKLVGGLLAPAGALLLIGLGI